MASCAEIRRDRRDARYGARRFVEKPSMERAAGQVRRRHRYSGDVGSRIGREKVHRSRVLV